MAGTSPAMTAWGSLSLPLPSFIPQDVIPDGQRPNRDRVKVECSFLRAIPALRYASAGMTEGWRIRPK